MREVVIGLYSSAGVPGEDESSLTALVVEEDEGVLPEVGVPIF